MKPTIRIKILRQLDEYTTEKERDGMFPGWKEFKQLSKGILEEDAEELDFVIAKKLETLEELNDQIVELENQREKLVQQVQQSKKAIQTCKPQPTMAQLLQYCSHLKDATQGNLTPNPK
jgi:uncharacterized coiled-coil protein SlyX